MEISGKKISILGVKRSGIAAAKLCKRQGGIPFVSDMTPYEDAKEQFDELTEAGINYEFGKHTEEVFNCDYIVTSPGVPSSAYPLVEAAKSNIPVYSELEFASWFCKGVIIGITGTNGKTTTTSLMAHVLNECGIKVFVAGNIGLAFSDIADIVTEHDYVALEISSFQLDYIKEFKPKYSVLLNITPDHLDRYDNSFEKYAAAKYKVAENQDANDYLIYNALDSVIDLNKVEGTPKLIPFSLKKAEEGFFVKSKEIIAKVWGREFKVCNTNNVSIPGEHNLMNALAVVSVASLAGLSSECIKRGLSSFNGVEHRVEFVRELNGVKYINDSKATNVDSVWYALRSFKSNIVLILGGKDKGNDYSHIKELVEKRVKRIYAIGSSADKVYNYFNEIVETAKVESLEEAVSKANEKGIEGDIVLLSPACASFDMFKNYEVRGKAFKEAVQKL